MSQKISTETLHDWLEHNPGYDLMIVNQKTGDIVPVNRGQGFVVYNMNPQYKSLEGYYHSMEDLEIAASRFTKRSREQTLRVSFNIYNGNVNFGRGRLITIGKIRRV